MWNSFPISQMRPRGQSSWEPKSQSTKRDSNLSMVANLPISNQLINSKFCVSLPHWSSSTVFYFPKVLPYGAWERGWQCWRKPSPQSGFSVRSNCKTRAFQNGNHFRLVFQLEKQSKMLSFLDKKIIKLTLSLSTCLNGREYKWKFNHRKLNFTDRVVYKMAIA